MSHFLRLLIVLLAASATSCVGTPTRPEDFGTLSDTELEDEYVSFLGVDESYVGWGDPEKDEYMTAAIGEIALRHPSWSFSIVGSIASETPLLGMNRLQARLSWGDPDDIYNEGGSSDHREEWIYRRYTANATFLGQAFPPAGFTAANKYLYFADGTLVEIRN